MAPIRRRVLRLTLNGRFLALILFLIVTGIGILQPARGFEGYDEPYFILNKPRAFSDFVGWHYTGRETFARSASGAVPVKLIGSLEHDETLSAVNGNAELRAGIAKSVTSQFGLERRAFKVVCLAGLHLVEPIEDIPLPTAGQTIVGSALYADTFVLARGSNTQFGANIDVALHNVSDTLSDLTGFVFGHPSAPVPVPSPVSSLDCENLDNQKLTDLQVAAGSPAPPPTMPPVPTSAPSSLAATTAPGATAAPTGPQPSPGSTALPIPSPEASVVEVAVDVSLTRAAFRIAKGHGLIVGVQLFSVVPIGARTTTGLDIAGTSATQDPYTVSFSQPANGNSNALCVLVHVSTSDSTINNADSPPEYCPPREKIKYISGDGVPPSYTPPTGFDSPYRVVAQIDDDTIFHTPTSQRTQTALDLSQVTIYFNNPANPSLSMLTGKVLINNQRFKFTPETRIRW